MTNRTLDLGLRNLRMHAQAPSWVLGRGALVLMLVIGLLVAFATSTRLGAAGLSLLTTVLAIDFLFVTLVAVGPFASALAEEREGDTLSVLRLAGLDPPAIVASKALGLLGSALLLLAVQVPFATLATTLGGVSWPQVATAFVTLVAYTLAAQGVALAMASRARTVKQAGARTAWILGAWLLLPKILELVASWLLAVGAVAPPRRGGPTPLADAIAWARDASPLASAFPTAGVPAPPLCLPATWLSLLVAGVGFALAVFGLGRDRVERQPRRPSRWYRPRVHGKRTAALVWKEENFLLGGKPAQQRRAVIYVVLFLLIGLLTYDPRGGWISTWSGACMATFLGIAYVEAGVAASHLFRDELRERTLFGLALLPIPPATWAMAKVRGATRAIRAPLIGAGVALVMQQLTGRAHTFWALMFVVPALVCLNLTLLLSLWLPRGAFLVGTAVTSVPLAMVAGAGSARDAMACGLIYVGGPMSIAFIGWVEVRIGRRLRQLATQY